MVKNTRFAVHRSKLPNCASAVHYTERDLSVMLWLSRDETMGLAEDFCRTLSPADAITVADAILFNAGAAQNNGDPPLKSVDEDADPAKEVGL